MCAGFTRANRSREVAKKYCVAVSSQFILITKESISIFYFFIFKLYSGTSSQFKANANTFLAAIRWG